jgi:hypothetical protein
MIGGRRDPAEVGPDGVVRAGAEVHPLPQA